MFKIHTEYLGLTPCKDAYSEMTIDEIYNYLSMEAVLSIRINNQLLFEEQIAIVEFYWYFTKWYREYSAGNKLSFSYCSVEHVMPIITFTFNRNGNWEVDSIWKHCEKAVLVEDRLFSVEVAKLAKQLESVLG